MQIQKNSYLAHSDILVLKKYMGWWWISAEDVRIYKVYYKKMPINHYVEIQWIYHVTLNSISYYSELSFY